MTTLDPSRVGPYVRALRAGVRALALDMDHVSEAALMLHLHALDPLVSGPLLLPAELDPRSGLPGLTWMDRVRAERTAAAEVRKADPQRIASIRRVDPELADRLEGRVRLLRTIGQGDLVPELAVEAHLVRRGEGRRSRGRRVRVVLDRRVPGIGWSRVRLEVDEPKEGGPVVAGVRGNGDVKLQRGFSELLARHVVSPLGALHQVLSNVGEVEIHRLSRGIFGPFWFPGGEVPENAPEWVAESLVLHSSLEVIGSEVRTQAHHDPLLPARLAPRTMGGHFRGRRLAVSPHAVKDATQWSLDRVGVADVVPILPGA